MNKIEMTFGRGRYAYKSMVNALEVGDRIILMSKGHYLIDNIITITKITDTQASGESANGCAYRFKREVYGSEDSGYRVSGYGTDSHRNFSLVTPKLMARVDEVNAEADKRDAEKKMQEKEAEARWMEHDAKRKKDFTPIAISMLAELPEYVQYLDGSEVENLVHWLGNFKTMALNNQEKAGK